MTGRPITFAGLAALAFSSCAPPLPDPPSAPPAWVHAPASGSALTANWWRAYGDPALDGLIRQAWSANPELASAAATAKAARADRQEALGALFPTAGIAVGRVDGREKNRATDLNIEPLDPWQSEAMLSWELDLTGKGRARLRAAESREAAAWARLEGAKLMLATEVAAARFESVLLGREAALLREQAAAERESARLTRALAAAGLASSADLASREADAGEFLRMADDLERRQGLARLRLDRLIAGKSPATAADPTLPPTPVRWPAETFSRRPDLIAAEADLRAAFHLESAARLDLLPSLSLAAGADGGQGSLTERFEMWTASVGPRLEIPVWDPSRLAEINRSRANAEAAAADFRATALRAVEEVEGRHLNLQSRRRQLDSATREATLRRRAQTDAAAKARAGLLSEIDATESRHQAYLARRTVLRLKLRALNDHLALVRALGG